MNLSAPNDEILRQNFAKIEIADKLNYKKNRDIELGENRVILRSPNGTRFALTVDNSGVLSASAVI